MKKRIKLLLFLLFSFLCLTIVSAKDTEIVNRKDKELLSNYKIMNTTEEYYINPLYKNIITEESLRKADSTKLYANTSEYYTTITSAAKDVRTKMKNRSNSFTISIKTSDTYSKAVKDIFEESLAHTGVSTEGDYLRWQYGGYRATIAGYSVGNDNYYDVTFTMTYYTSSEQEAKLSTEITKVMKSLNLSGTNFENLTKIYNYIIKNTTYDYDHLEDPNYTLQYTAYAALINKTAVCQGYALLVYRMALEAGIDTRLIAGYGSSERHGWNIVKLGKYYYNVDATWDASYVNYGSTPFYLKNNANFPNHTRDAEYNDTTFNNKYPMSLYDYANQPDKDIPNGLSYNEVYKRWEYYTNGKVNYNYSGIATNEYGIWYVDKGLITFKHNEVIYYNNKWVAFVNSKLNTTYTGISSNKSGTWYVKNGVVDFKYNGTYKDSKGNVYLFKNSKVNTSITEVRQENNTWYYFQNGIANLSYTGTGTNKSGIWYVKNGIVDFKYNGTYKDTKGVVYTFKNSKVNTNYTGLKNIGSAWYYLKNGVSDYTYNGIATNEYGTWYVDKGVITFKHNEAIYYNNKWVAFVNSKLNPTYTGLSSNKSGTWYVKNGEIDFKYNGTYKDSNGKTYKIKNSKVIG